MIHNEVSNDWDTGENRKGVLFPTGNDSFFLEHILGSELNKEIIEIVGSLEKSKEWETDREIDLSQKNDSEVPKPFNKLGKPHSEVDQAFEEEAIRTAGNDLNVFLDELEASRPTPGEQTNPAPFLPSHVTDLINDTRRHLTGMEAFAVFAKDKFRDPELGMRYQKAFLRRIDKMMSLLNSYANYLSLKNPVKEPNTINSLFEKILTKHTERLEDHQIAIIKKQFTEPLPETTVPEAQIEYILDSLVQYIIHSISPHGNLGLLTRLIDDPKRTWGENMAMGKGQKYVEILFVLIPDKQESDRPSSNPKGQNMDLILSLVSETLEKNRGFMEIKPSDKNAMTFISLGIPVEK